jgi:hypothetical protein
LSNEGVEYDLGIVENTPPRVIDNLDPIEGYILEEEIDANL